MIIQFRFRTFAKIAICLISHSIWADSLQFDLLPANGNIAGPSGSLIGWGYTLTNLSTADWLVTTNLSTDSFLYDTPTLLFDFPILGPGQTVSETFSQMSATGLYEVLLNANAPTGLIDSGSFVLSGQWWDGDPANGGGYLADAVDSSVPYSVSNSSSQGIAPEPSEFALILLGVCALLAFARKWPIRLRPQVLERKRLTY